MRGADPAALEEKVKKWYGEGDEGDTDVGVKGHVSMILVEFVVYSFNCVACVQPKLIRYNSLGCSCELAEQQPVGR